MKARPFSPIEAEGKLSESIINAVNELLSKNYKGNSAKLFIDDIAAMSDYQEKHCELIMQVYKDYGWMVFYDCANNREYLMFLKK